MILEGTHYDVALIIALIKTRLIVIMLSKLRMTASDAAKELSKFCEQVYAPGLSPEERTSTCRKCIEDLLKRRGLPEDLEMGRNDRVQEGCPW